MTAKQIIQLLNLQPLPQEGGFFGVTYTSNEELSSASLPPRYDEARHMAGAIYFLETLTQFSAMHRLITDENYYFHYGDTLEILLLHPDGTGELKRIGMDLESGHRPQLLAPRNSWQGSRPQPGGKFGFTLISTSMAPGYHQNDVEFGGRGHLITEYPEFADLITALTRDKAINT